MAKLLLVVLVAALGYGAYWFLSELEPVPSKTASTLPSLEQPVEKPDPLHAALGEVKSALQESPEDIDLRWRYAQLLLERGDAVAASSQIERVFSKRPSQEVAVARLEALLMQGQYKRVLTLADLMDADFGHAALFHLRGEANRFLGKPFEARADYQRALAEDSNNLDSRLALARVALSEGKYEEMERQLKSVLQHDPEAVDVHLIRGNASYRQMQLEESKAAYQQALAIEADSGEAIVGLAQVALSGRDMAALEEQVARLDETGYRSRSALYLRGLTAIEAGNLDQAVAHFREILQHYGAHYYSLRHLADLYQRRGDWVLAELHLEKAAAQRSDDPVLMLTKARVSRALGEFEEAHEALDFVRGLDPDSADVQFERALTLASQGRMEDSDKALERALEMQPDHLAAKAVLGRRFLEKGDSQGALALAEALQGTRLGAAEGLALEGRVRLAAGDTARAVELHRRAQEAEPGAARALELALALDAQGDREAAARLLRDWAKAHPSNPESHRALADFAAATGDIEAAIAAYKKVLALQEDDLAALGELAALHEEHDPNLAADYARRAAEQAPKSAELQSRYGWLQLESGAVQQGLKALTLAIRLDPDGRLLRYRHAVALARAERSDQARSAFETLVAEDEQDEIAKDAAAWLERLGEP